MNLTTKRYIISTSETFIVSFLWTFLLQIDTVISAGQLPTKEILISAITAWLISGLKVVVKVIREIIQQKQV